MAVENKADQQISLTSNGSMPTKRRIQFSGAIHTHREVARGEEVHVTVVDADGTVVADGYGKVVAESFADFYDADGELEDTIKTAKAKIS